MTISSFSNQQLDSLSIVVPCFNEEAVLDELHRRLTAACSMLGLNYQLILVDDGSTDSTWSRITGLASRDEAIVGVRLSRNFGQQEAILAGLRIARGSVISTLDADLQDPPELLAPMLAECKRGAHVVFGVRIRRKHDPFLKRLFARTFYAVIRRATGLDIPANTGEFRLARRTVVDAVLQMKESRPFLRGMFIWVGFPRGYVNYDRPERIAGDPKFTFSRSLRLALDAFVSFSELRQKLLLWLGGLTAGSAAIVLGFLFFYPATLAVTTVILSIMLFSLGLQQLTSGFLSIGRGPLAHRPEYIVQELAGSPERFAKPA